jgi:hypothetical protein
VDPAPKLSQSRNSDVTLHHRRSAGSSSQA